MENHYKNIGNNQPNGFRHSEFDL